MSLRAVCVVPLLAATLCGQEPVANVMGPDDQFHLVPESQFILSLGEPACPRPHHHAANDFSVMALDGVEIIDPENLDPSEPCGFDFLLFFVPGGGGGGGDGPPGSGDAPLFGNGVDLWDRGRGFGPPPPPGAFPDGANGDPLFLDGLDDVTGAGVARPNAAVFLVLWNPFSPVYNEPSDLPGYAPRLVESLQFFGLSGEFVFTFFRRGAAVHYGPGFLVPSNAKAVYKPWLNKIFFRFPSAAPGTLTFYETFALDFLHEFIHAWVDQLVETGEDGVGHALWQEGLKLAPATIIKPTTQIPGKNATDTVANLGLDPETVLNEAWGCFAEAAINELIGLRRSAVVLTAKKAQARWDAFLAGDHTAYDPAVCDALGNPYLFPFKLTRATKDYLVDLLGIDKDVTKWRGVKWSERAEPEEPEEPEEEDK